MYDDYYGPGSEEYDRDMREEWEQEKSEWEQEYQQYKQEQELRDQMYDDEDALQETLRDAAREDCYADYSGGKSPTMRCDYHSESSGSTAYNLDAATFFGMVFIFSIVGFFIYLLVKPSKKKWY